MTKQPRRPREVRSVVEPAVEPQPLPGLDAPAHEPVAPRAASRPGRRARRGSCRRRGRTGHSRCSAAPVVVGRGAEGPTGRSRQPCVPPYTARACWSTSATVGTDACAPGRCTASDAAAQARSRHTRSSQALRQGGGVDAAEGVAGGHGVGRLDPRGGHAEVGAVAGHQPGALRAERDEHRGNLLERAVAPPPPRRPAPAISTASCSLTTSTSISASRTGSGRRPAPR